MRVRSQAGNNCRQSRGAAAPGLIILVLFLFFGGCAAPKPKPRYIWPVPPEQARVEYLQSIYRAEDIQLKPDSLSKALLGKQEPLFQTPFDILVEQNGNLIISDSKVGILWLLDSSGKINSLPRDGKRLQYPLGLARDDDGRLYVSEGKGKRIAVLDPTGKIERFIGEQVFAGNPSFLALDKKRRQLYASDSRNHQVQVFNCAGEHLRTIGSPGTGPGELAGPQGLAVNDQGELIVADMLNSRLSVFSAEGEFLRNIPFNGWGPYYFSSPKGLTIGQDGKIWVTDQRVGALISYSRDEKPEMVIGAGRMSAHPMAFVAPSGVSISPDGSLWVADILMRRLSHWQQLTPAYLENHPFDAETRHRLETFGKRFSMTKKE